MSIEVTDPIDFAAVEKALVDWATSVVPDFSAAIFAHQNAPQPARPYCLFTYQNIEQKGDDDVRLEFDAITGKQTQIIAGQRVIELGVDVLAAAPKKTGPNPNLFAMPLAGRLIASFGLEEAVLVPLREVGVAVADVSNVDNLTALEGAEWVSRARFVLRLNVAANVVPLTPRGVIIDSVSVEGPDNLTTPPNTTQTIDGDNPP
jgi:hypothetical protein